jgi:hypothetical protein
MSRRSSIRVALNKQHEGMLAAASPSSPTGCLVGLRHAPGWRRSRSRGGASRSPVIVNRRCPRAKRRAGRWTSVRAGRAGVTQPPARTRRCRPCTTSAQLRAGQSRRITASRCLRPTPGWQRTAAGRRTGDAIAVQLTLGGPCAHVGVPSTKLSRAAKWPGCGSSVRLRGHGRGWAGAGRLRFSSWCRLV